MSEITEAIGTVSVNVIVQAMVTIILTVAIVVMVVLSREIPDHFMTAWLVSIGVWIPQPDRRYIESRHRQ